MYLCHPKLRDKLDMKKHLILLSLAIASVSLMADEAPFHITDGLFDASQKETMGLELAPGAETFTVFSAAENTDHYANGIVMTAFKGALYCMWQSSQKFPLNGCPAGVCLIRIRTSQETLVRKIILR